MTQTTGTGQPNSDMVTIPRKKLIDLLIQQCRMQYMLTILGAICFQKNINYCLTPQDVCEFLEIDFETFEQALLKADPKHTIWQGGNVYTLETIVRIAEMATRPQRLKNLLKQSRK